MSYHVTKKVFEVVEMAANAKTKAEKIEILQKHQTQALKDVLLGTYDDYVEWNLPDGKPPYEPADENGFTELSFCLIDCFSMSSL